MIAALDSASSDPAVSAAHFIAEEFTPLFHAREYRALPEVARRRYNQLHALYYNEQVAFFEQEMLSPVLLALQRGHLPSRLAESVRVFFEEEQRHTAMFCALNRQCAPEFYASSDYYFVRASAPLRAVLGAMARGTRVFPLLVWLALLQEERSLFYSKGCVARAGELDPRFVATHRTHLADEIGHVGWDEELLDWLWPRTNRALRAANARLLAWMLGEFFLLPKRSGACVVDQLTREFPQLDAAALTRALRDLKDNGGYLRSLYSREVTPRSFARFDALPEFASLGRTLPGYRPPTA